MKTPQPRAYNPNGRCRIVLTGGPGGGKTTAADLFRREIGERVVIVAEAATLLFSGGFPRSSAPGALEATQTAIYQVQRKLEDVQSALFPERVLLCDRGTVDGAAYWPGEPDTFFAAVGTTEQQELDRYDAVIFFESAAVGGISMEGGNPVRVESTEEAAHLDLKLRHLWSKHPRFVIVPHEPVFLQEDHVRARGAREHGRAAALKRAYSSRRRSASTYSGPVPQHAPMISAPASIQVAASSA